MSETVLLILWSARSLRALLRSAAFWQVKEYRRDRARAHWQSPSAWREVRSLRVLLKIGLAAAFLLSGQRAFPLVASVLITLVWGYETARFARELARGSFARPRRTIRILGVLGGGALLASLLFFALLLLGAPLPAAALVVDLTLPLPVLLAVAGTGVLTFVQRQHAFAAASQIIRLRPNLITVGITGSYGKTSTKEFLTELLCARFRVQATPEHVNTEIGIANFIRRGLRRDTHVFVCEMGAYREGEIARACAIARPRLGILTSISDQHLSLFGSQQSIIRAKGEILRALPTEGTAIVNWDNPLCRDATNGVSARRVLRFGHDPVSDIRAESVEIGEDTLTVQVTSSGGRIRLTAPLLGHLQVPNLLGAVAAAQALGMTAEEIEDAAGGLKPVPRTMEPLTLSDGTRIIDDSYSANPDGVLAALEFLGHVSRPRRVVVLSPMIELGSQARREHQRVGERLGTLRPALIVCTSSDFSDALRAGIQRVHPEVLSHFRVEPDARRAEALLAPFRGPDTVWLLEGRIPEALRRSVRPLHS